MSKIGHLLASKKKASAKASVDIALKAMTINDDITEAKILKDLKAESVVPKADDWGVDDDDNTETAAALSSAPGGGRFYLISEEDVTKKQTNKVARKWGEKDATTSVPAVPEAVAAPVVEEAPAAPAAPVLYSSKLRNRIRATPKSKLDLEDAHLFPELGLGTPSASTGSHDDKRKPKKKVAAAADDVDDSEDEKFEDSSAVDIVTSPQADEPVVVCEVGPSVMSVQEFLKDIVVPSFDVVIDNDQIQKKYMSRKKRPIVALPPIEGF